MHIQTLNEGFQVPLQEREEDSTEYNTDYFDSQEATLFASTSNSDDLEEHEFHEGGYESEDSMGLEECWWPQKCLYNVESLKKKLHLREGERKRKKGTERIASPLQTAGEGEPILPSSLPPLQAHEHLQDHEPGGCSQGGLQPTSGGPATSGGPRPRGGRSLLGPGRGRPWPALLGGGCGQATPPFLVGPGVRGGCGGPPSFHSNPMGLVEEGGPVHFSSPNPPLLDIWVGFGGKEVAMPNPLPP
jgi:hypothetical protein